MLTNALLDAIRSGDAARVRRLLEAGAEPDRRPTTATTWASSGPRVRPLTSLLNWMNFELICKEKWYGSGMLAEIPRDMYRLHPYNRPGADPVACCAALLEAGASPNRISGASPFTLPLPFWSF